MSKKVKEYYFNPDGQLVDAKEGQNNSPKNNEQQPTVQDTNTNKPNVEIETQNINNGREPLVRETIVRETYSRDPNVDNNYQNYNNPNYNNPNYNNQNYYNQNNNYNNFNNNNYQNNNQNIVQNQNVVNTYQNQDINPDYKRPLFRESIIAKKDFTEDSKLLGNPFFYDYNPDIQDNIHQINTIEDFYILRKKKYYNFGGLVRKNEMFLFKRRRILKSQMKQWNQEFEKRLSDVSTLGSSQFQTTEKQIGKGINIIFPILAFLAIIASFILLNGNLWIFTKPSQNWALLATYASFICSFFAILMTHLINRSVKAIKKLYEFNRNEYSHRKQEIDREFQKRYKLVYNYYVKGLKKKFKKPVLLLDKTAIGESNIRNIESVITDNSKKLMDANRTERRLVFPKFLLNALSVLSCVYVFGYAIFEIVIYFIKK